MCGDFVVDFYECFFEGVVVGYVMDVCFVGVLCCGEFFDVDEVSELVGLCVGSVL